jgi:hypothetical protein
MTSNRLLRALCVVLALAFFHPPLAVADEPPYPTFNEWWQWSLSLPSAVNPILDNSGQRCAFGQRGNLWFLAGNTGGRTNRACTLPAGARVMIPIHNTVCFLDEVDDAASCAAATAADFASFTRAEVQFSGPEAPLVFEQPPTVPGEWDFTFSVPRNGIFGLKPGLYRAVSAAGRWAFVNLPTPGVYTLRVQAASTSGFELDVTYLLTVAEVN